VRKKRLSEKTFGEADKNKVGEGIKKRKSVSRGQVKMSPVVWAIFINGDFIQQKINDLKNGGLWNGTKISVF
jgi:hypothetical protein